MAAVSAKLSKDKAKRFAELYVFETNKNASAAYRQMLTELDLPIPNNLRRQAHIFLHKDIVQEYIQEYQQEAIEIYDVDKEQIVAKLKELAFDDSQTAKTQLAALKQLTDMGGFAQQNLNIQGAQTYEVIIK